MSAKIGCIKTIKGKRGNTYCVQIRLKGHKNTSRTFKELKEAKKWLKETLYAISQGKAYETKVMRSHTFSDLINKYIDEELDKSSSNYKTRLGQLNWWKAELGHLSLVNIKEDVISTCRKKLLGTNDRYGNPRSMTTANRYMTSLSVVLRKAVKEWRLMTYNPVSNFQKYKEPNGRDRFLSEEEIERLLKACKNSSNQHLYSIVLLALCTGMRKGEIINLKWEDIDFQRDLIKLKKTKNGDMRNVPLKGSICDILKKRFFDERPSLNLYVFKGKKCNKPINFRGAWSIALKEAEIKDFVFHSLRATCVTYLSKLGYSLHLIAKIVGHKEVSITYKRYACLSMDEHFKATERLGSFFKSLL
ncbi:MAG: site-specific integrase [Chlamydiota bacterium]|jgi:integrase